MDKTYLHAPCSNVPRYTPPLPHAGAGLLCKGGAGRGYGRVYIYEPSPTHAQKIWEHRGERLDSMRGLWQVTRMERELEDWEETEEEVVSVKVNGVETMISEVKDLG